MQHIHTPIISVVVIVHATEPYLRRALDSLINQTLQNIEIIVVNDASPGNCNAIVQEYQEKDKRIILVEHEVQKGKLQARLTGFLHSNGLYIQHLDSDDSLTLDACQILANALKESHADISYCSLHYIQPTSSNSLFMPYAPKHSCIVTQKDMLFGFLNYTYHESRDFTLFHSIVLFCIKREVYAKAYNGLKDMPDFSLYEDLLHLIALMPHIKTLVCLKDTLYNYYLGLSSTSLHPKKHLVKLLQNLMGVLDCSEKILLQHNLCTSEEFFIRKRMDFHGLYNMFLHISNKELSQQLEDYSREDLLSYILTFHSFYIDNLLYNKKSSKNLSLFQKLLLRYNVEGITKSLKQIRRGFLALILSICLLFVNGFKKICKIKA